jgi:hypothetical protein
MRRMAAALVLGWCATTVVIAGAAAAAEDPPGSSVPETTESDEQAAAEESLLTLEDFPAGWTETPDPGLTALAVESRRRIAECVGVDGDSLLDLGGALAESGTFRGPNEQAVEESVAIVDEALAEDVMARLGAAGVDVCFAEAMQQTVDAMVTNPSDPSESFPADTEVGKVTVDPLAIAPAGDELVAYRITVPLTIHGTSVDLTLDAVAVRSGSSIAGLSFQSVLEPFPTEVIERYVSIAVERLPG